MDEKIEKLDNAIDAIIDQIEYVSTASQIERGLRTFNKSNHDPNRDKIRSNSDLVFQLSTSLTSLLAAKHTIEVYSSRQSQKEMYEMLFSGSYKGSDKREQ